MTVNMVYSITEPCRIPFCSCLISGSVLLMRTYISLSDRMIRLKFAILPVEAHFLEFENHAISQAFSMLMMMIASQVTV